MPLDIKIQDSQISDLSNGAKIELTKQVDVYIGVLLSEARLIEEDLREKDAKKEITSSHIAQAARRGKNKFNKRKPRHVKFCRVLSPISILLTGILFDRNGFTDNQMQFVFFIIFLVIAVAATIFQFPKEDE